MTDRKELPYTVRRVQSTFTTFSQAPQEVINRYIMRNQEEIYRQIIELRKRTEDQSIEETSVPINMYWEVPPRTNKEIQTHYEHNMLDWESIEEEAHSKDKHTLEYIQETYWTEPKDWNWVPTSVPTKEESKQDKAPTAYTNMMLWSWFDYKDECTKISESKVNKAPEMRYEVGDEVYLDWNYYRVEDILPDWVYLWILSRVLTTTHFTDEDIKQSKDSLNNQEDPISNFSKSQNTPKELEKELDWIEETLKDLNIIEEEDKNIDWKIIRENYTQFITSKIEDISSIFTDWRTATIHNCDWTDVKENWFLNKNTLKEILREHLLPNTNTDED